jgi:hypothetical protein
VFSCFFFAFVFFFAFIFQYSTGIGSMLRHMYQVATVLHGSQLAATSLASWRVTGSPLK